MTAILDRQSKDGYIDIILPFDISDQEFFQFCQLNRNLNFERNADGTIIILPLSGFNTSVLSVKIGSALVEWNRIHQLGMAAANVGYILPNKAIRAPKLSWISKERLSGLSEAELEKFPHVCPEFVIEILSPSDSLKKAKAKMIEYIENGCLLGWLIDRKKKQVFIYRADGSISINKSFEEPLSGEEVLPGFVLDLSVFK